MPSGTGGKNIQVFFLAAVCPKEYKNGKIFDRQFFGPPEAISLTVLWQLNVFSCEIKYLFPVEPLWTA